MPRAGRGGKTLADKLSDDDLINAVENPEKRYKERILIDPNIIEHFKLFAKEMGLKEGNIAVSYSLLRDLYMKWNKRAVTKKFVCYFLFHTFQQKKHSIFKYYTFDSLEPFNILEVHPQYCTCCKRNYHLNKREWTRNVKFKEWKKKIQEKGLWNPKRVRKKKVNTEISQTTIEEKDTKKPN